MKPSFLLGLFFLTAGLPSGTAVDATETTFLSRARQLTFEGRRSGEGYFSPDGKALIFQSEREPGNPFYQIYILDLETGDTHRVSPGTGKTTCAFFRPGTDEVLFASTHLDPEAEAKQEAELEFRASGKQRRYSWDYDERMDLFAARRDGSNIKRLTDAPGYDAEGAYSPDGKLIVFCSTRHGYADPKSLSPEDQKRLEVDPAWFGEIYLMNADGTGIRRLTHSPGYDGGPFFSPDGKRIIWRRFDESGMIADIFTMDLNGGDVRQLTDFGSMSWAPYFHPSGEYVIFTSNKLGFSNFELYLAAVDGSREPVRVTFTDGFDGLPVFSPDGKRLAWTSNRTTDGQSQIFIADWNHAAALEALDAAPARATGSAPQARAPASAEPIAPVPDLSPAITAEDLRRHVEYLASEPLAGRMTGTEGTKLAANYASRLMEAAALKPAGDGKEWFQTFSFTAGVNLVTNDNELTFLAPGPAPRSFQVETDFRPLAFTANGTVEGEVVFAGYGLSVPGKPGEGYDSYAGLNVSNKIVLVLRYVPEAVEPKRRQELNRYAGLRYKAMIAREHGAKALLVVTGPNSPNAGGLVNLTFDNSIATSDIVAMSVTRAVADAILAPSGKDLRSLQTALDSENPHAESGFPIPEVKLRIRAAVEHLKQSDRNVLGMLPPSHPAPNPEYVLVGAHYDHLGLGETGAMLRPGEEGQIHFGADDNASGTAAVLELASALSAERERNADRFQRGIIFALWSGEELGLIGSSHFASHPTVPLSNIVAYLNFDMIGRLRDNKLSLQGTGSSTRWPSLVEKRNVAAGFDLSLQSDPYLPTDVASFYPKQIPVLNFFTGSHEDYHRPTDRPETLNYEGLERITRFAESLIRDLVSAAEPPDYVAGIRSERQGGGRETLRAYLGTIPDYTTEVSGVKINGARPGSPADKAGLKAGDVIVEFGGQKIANIYDYTYALDAAKIGEPTSLVIRRGDETIRLSITPEARK